MVLDMTWTNPLPLRLLATQDSESFSTMPEGTTGLPLGQHPGAFGVERKHHTHEGVDLYCDRGTPVYAVEDGIISSILDFTGEAASPPSPWWHDTKALLIEGDSGVVLYGEITPTINFWPGDLIKTGQLLGQVCQVLKTDKGRPMTMLHLELHKPGTVDAAEWIKHRPASLLDPTPHLLELVDNPEYPAIS